MPKQFGLLTKEGVWDKGSGGGGETVVCREESSARPISSPDIRKAKSRNVSDFNCRKQGAGGKPRQALLRTLQLIATIPGEAVGYTPPLE